MRDHHFPRFHVRPPRGFVNDPNGPILLADGLHLYFQYRSAASGAGPVSWGHAISRDFAHWSQEPLAITSEPTGLDADGCWSGNTVLHRDQVVAFYSAYRAASKYQSVVRACSTDGGSSFNAKVQAVPDPGPEDNIAHFRDPFVWRAGDRWRMAVGAGAANEVASVRLFESMNLDDWTPVGELARMPRQLTDVGDTGAMWECPQVATFDGVDVLIVSPWSPGHDLMQVLTLSRLDTPQPIVGRLDHGTNFYAASVLRDSPFGTVIWGWATEARSLEWSVSADWAGMLTLPRALSMRTDGTVASSPLPTMEKLRTSQAAVVRDGSGVVRASGLPAQSEIRLDLENGPSRPTVLARIRFGPSEHLDIGIDWSSGVVSIDRSHASADPRATGDTASFTEPNCFASASLQLTAYLDGSILELFTNSGRCATVRMYPTSPPPWSLEVQGINQGDNVDCWLLSS